MSKIFRYDNVKLEITMEGASKVKVRWLITKEMGAKNFAMRIFEVEPNGYSPCTNTHGSTKFSYWKAKASFSTAKKQPHSNQETLFLFRLPRCTNSGIAGKRF
jgi:hypothetical protein